MAQIEKFLVALFLFAMAHSIILVDATFSKSMYITWGSRHASMQGEDLQLVLDQTSGNVNHRIQAGWMKWRKVSGVLCDAKVPIKLKEKFYRTAVRPAILYGTECWAVKSQHENKVGVAEMRMLRWMCGKTRQDKIRNEAIRERVGVAPIVEKMVENRLRWFGHVERRPVDSVVRRVDQMERRQTIRGRGRPKKTIREVIKKDLEINGLDRRSAAQTKKAFLFGSIESRIKLVPGNSAGTVTAYYLSSTGSQHDEIDFEFLGNISGQPYIVHTNIYTQGNGSREQQFYLWFDPTADFHNYTIHWNPIEVVWYIDSIPIRAYRNYENEGIAYPNKQGMRVYTSLWNADDWATRGGLVKTNWSGAPFIARFNHFRARACKWNGAVSINQCALNFPANWWTSPTYKQLSYAKLGQMNWVRNNYMIYDYCRDTKRFNGRMPPECFKSQF
ncbi:putative xyloglucan endotransglucosylase/hydrolase protein 26 [Glycine soja]